MSVSISNAWSWSFKRSPLMAIWRTSRSWLAPNKDAYALLQAAALPADVDAAIRTTVTRTKLWRDEREQIARELIVHAQDAIEAGQTPEQIVETFGDPKRVARLMRRSMKRKRPLVWQAYRFFRRAMGVLAMLLIVGYGVLAVRFYTGEPTIRTDYIAQLNARTIQYGDSQRAWSIYAQADIDWKNISIPMREAQLARISAMENREYEAGLKMFPFTATTHPDYDEVAQAVRAFAPQLQGVRAATKLPVVGAPLSYKLQSIKVNEQVTVERPVPLNADEKADGSLIGLRLAHLEMMRQLSNVLAFDAKLAARDGDFDRSVENLLSIANIANQCNQEPFVISGMVGIAINNMFGRLIVEVLREHPGVFSKQQLAQLAHANALTPRMRLSLETERMFFDDILQRCYTDDGNGNGRLTPEGASMMVEMETIYWYAAPHKQRGYQAIQAAVMPTLLLAMNDRATERGIYDSMLNRARQVLEQGPQSISWLAYESMMHSWRIENRLPVPSPAEMATPALGQAVQRLFQSEMSDQAVSAMLAIEVYQVVHGRLPESLDEVPGSLLPEIPQDAFDIGMPIRYMQGEQGGYVLYSVGADGDDDYGALSGSAHAKVSDLFLRYPFKITQDEVFKPTVELDDAGQPKIGDPAGPNGDWILVDTRPQTSVESEPAADS